jgi:cytochrome o ubiquinol oxidase subunit 3
MSVLQPAFPTGAVPAGAPAAPVPPAAPPVFYDNGDHHPQQGTLLGFWLYLMSDCLIFAVLFATHAVFGRSYAAGPSGADLFDLRLVAVNTALLLLSSLTYGLAMIGAQRGRQGTVLGWLAVTGLLGLGFLALELYEFAHLIQQGAGPQPSCRPSSRWSARTACTWASARCGWSR